MLPSPSACPSSSAAVVTKGIAPVRIKLRAESVRRARPKERQRYVSRSVMWRGSVAARETMSLGVRRSGRDWVTSQAEVPRA